MEIFDKDIRLLKEEVREEIISEITPDNFTPEEMASFLVAYSRRRFLELIKMATDIQVENTPDPHTTSCYTNEKELYDKIKFINSFLHLK